MRRILPLLAAMAVFACGPALSGTYQLVSINDMTPPATVESYTITSGSLTLTSESTYSSTFTVHEGDGDPETYDESGTFTRDESNVIHFTPGPEAEGEEPSEGTWDGDQITIMVDDLALVFRR